MAKKLTILSIIFWSGLLFLTLPSNALKSPQKDLNPKISLQPSYGKLPLSFIENKGQLDKSVFYYMKGKQGNIFFTKTGMVYDLYLSQSSNSKKEKYICPLKDSKKKLSKRTTFTLKPLNTNNETRIVSAHKLPGRVNYLIGRSPENWHTDIPVCKEIIYKNLYKGIDLKVYGTNPVCNVAVFYHHGKRKNPICCSVN